MNQEMKELLQIETKIIAILREVYDPEIPVNVYDLGLIYDILVSDDRSVLIKMTLTAPNCPIADDIVLQVKEAAASVPEVADVKVELVFDPPWSQDMIGEEAKLELGLL
ncbi:MAG: iron-sulfur cluster assembly protein [Bacteroidales bacterium]|jgi:FeS assembly SUF system protein|nr:iron-sulfur cluster assembly protein [Bacteroidales bacterium]